MRISLALVVPLLLFSTLDARAQAGRGRGGPPPRIVSFEAKPATVKAGEPVLLVWQTENPSGVAIAPDVGAVTPRGSRQVTPTATTTYTLTMNGGPTRSVTVTVQGAVTSTPPRSQSATTSRSTTPDL